MITTLKNWDSFISHFSTLHFPPKISPRTFFTRSFFPPLRTAGRTSKSALSAALFHQSSRNVWGRYKFRETELRCSKLRFSLSNFGSYGHELPYPRVYLFSPSSLRALYLQSLVGEKSLNLPPRACLKRLGDQKKALQSPQNTSLERKTASKLRHWPLQA